MLNGRFCATVLLRCSGSGGYTHAHLLLHKEAHTSKTWTMHCVPRPQNQTVSCCFLAPEPQRIKLPYPSAGCSKGLQNCNSRVICFRLHLLTTTASTASQHRLRTLNSYPLTSCQTWKRLHRQEKSGSSLDLYTLCHQKLWSKRLDSGLEALELSCSGQYSQCPARRSWYILGSWRPLNSREYGMDMVLISAIHALQTGHGWGFSRLI